MSFKSLRDDGAAVLLDKDVTPDAIGFNDLTTDAAGRIYVGSLAFHVVAGAPPKPGHLHVIDVDGTVRTVSDGVVVTNGLAFSPDENKLYIVESGTVPRAIYAFDVVGDGSKLANGKKLIVTEKEGTPDGFRVDVDGNLWCGWGMGTAELDGVRIFNPQGVPIGHISLPERAANVCFGGPKRNRLFMAASHSIYALYVNTQGLKGG